MFTYTSLICKLTKAVVLNSFPHGRFWQLVFKNKEHFRCTRLMRRSLHNDNTTVRDLDACVRE
jgi:hypothetical protein